MRIVRSHMERERPSEKDPRLSLQFAKQIKCPPKRNDVWSHLEIEHKNSSIFDYICVV